MQTMLTVMGYLALVTGVAVLGFAVFMATQLGLHGSVFAAFLMAATAVGSGITLIEWSRGKEDDE